MPIYNIEDEEIREAFLIEIHDYKFVKKYEDFLYRLYNDLIKNDIIISNGKYYKLKTNIYGNFVPKHMNEANKYISENYLVNLYDLYYYNQIINGDNKHYYICINLNFIKKINRAKNMKKMILEKYENYKIKNV